MAATCGNDHLFSPLAALGREDDDRGFCVIDRHISGGLVNIVVLPEIGPTFPIAEEFPELDLYLGV